MTCDYFNLQICYKEVSVHVLAVEVPSGCDEYNYSWWLQLVGWTQAVSWRG